MKPRLDSALRPLPGCGMALIAPARLIASLRLLSPRCSSCSREITVRLAGVCNTPGPTQSPRWRWTTVHRCGYRPPHRIQRGRGRVSAQARGGGARRRRAGWGSFSFFTACKATPQWQSKSKRDRHRAWHRPWPATPWKNVHSGARLRRPSRPAAHRAPNVPLICRGNPHRAAQCAAHRHRTAARPPPAG